MNYYNDQPHRPVGGRTVTPDEENTVRYTDDKREAFDISIDVSDLMDQPPWHGVYRIEDIQIEGTIVEDFEYEVVNGHRDPASDYSTYSYEDVVVTFWARDGQLKVLEAEIGDMSEGDASFGRFLGQAEASTEDGAAQPFYQFLVGNSELSGYFPQEIS